VIGPLGRGTPAGPPGRGGARLSPARRAPAITAFAVQNMQTAKISFVNWAVTAPFAWVIVGVYFLGMVSGWTVVAFVQRSFRQVTAHRES
jgi:putative membrane protein